MQNEYDFSKMKSRNNPYASKLKKPFSPSPVAQSALCACTNRGLAYFDNMHTAHPAYLRLAARRGVVNKIRLAAQLFGCLCQFDVGSRHNFILTQRHSEVQCVQSAQICVKTTN